MHHCFALNTYALSRKSDKILRITYSYRIMYKFHYARRIQHTKSAGPTLSIGPFTVTMNFA